MVSYAVIKLSIESKDLNSHPRSHSHLRSYPRLMIFFIDAEHETVIRANRKKVLLQQISPTFKFSTLCMKM